jgi:hypothetical protein
MNVRQLFRREQSVDTMETAAVLKVLAGMAARGEITGVALCYRERGGNDQAVFVGSYKVRPSDAVNAAMRLSWELTKAQDAMTG